MSDTEPVKKLVIKGFAKGTFVVEPGTYVWLLKVQPNGLALIEYRQEQCEVPAYILTDTPVAAPMEKLVKLDPCFGREREAFKEIYQDEDLLFRILECEHGNLFLEDIQSGILWYSRLIFMGQTLRTRDVFVDFWKRHHSHTDDQIRLQGIGF